ncbi:DUF6090 family protein [uncultured Eudoraea sp.]|uniref:DUF6090 family protein n=1 Tax=uncultured Eudoraea sp. TaxID=1035614 RepID=UPI0026068809|nr:DUF6090 family protein [uncultured Eudoraea sp.]
MIGFFRKIRKKLADDNQFFKYSRYALGEILLVVIGILIALQINNWNEERKLVESEITLLTNIREDILLDTLDISFNLEYHRKFQREEQKLLEYLLGNRTSITDINMTDALGIKLWTALHRSTFENLQNNEVGLVQNNSLRKNIARFYDFYYRALSKMHNEFKSFDLYEKKMPFFRTYFTVIPDSTDYVLKFPGGEDYYDHDLYKKAIQLQDPEGARTDNEFIFILNECSLFRKAMIDFNQSVLNEVRGLIIEIDNELNNLK